MSSAFIMSLTLAAPQLSHAMENELELAKFPQFTRMPKEVRDLTVRQAAYEQCLDDNAPVTLKKTLGNLKLVCKEWQLLINDEMKVNMPSWQAAWYGVVGHEEIYQQFLNGTLIYKPNPQSDEGMIQLKISDLLNPLEGTFDLSGCGDTSKYLSISTGYRKGMKAENGNKLEIWLATRFMVKKKLNSSASHLQPIMNAWDPETAPIGILWSWGGWNDLSWYDYHIQSGDNEISSKNLYDNWTEARCERGHFRHAYEACYVLAQRKFSCSFVNQNKNY